MSDKYEGGLKMEFVSNRRSIRKYTDEKISRDKIEKILKAGMNAPSAHNQQPYRFVVIEDKEMLADISRNHPYAKMIKFAACAILVFFDDKILKDADFIQQDCAAATENILIKANELGVGSVWLGVYPKQEIMNYLSDRLSMEKNHIPFSLISLGIPAEIKQGHNRYNEDWIIYK
jgi:nitroreductase